MTTAAELQEVDAVADNSCCSTAAVILTPDDLTPKMPNIPDAPWIVERIKTSVGDVPRVPTELTFADVLGSWKARWDINRMDYAVTPGLYCVGYPNSESPVLVTANYKMSFDRLRQELGGINAWILVLDTKGINVWCAAGKGTFGTAEIIKRINAAYLHQVVSHRTIILPQLGAPGVMGHEVKKQTGFKVVYGPVRAEDIPAFLAANMKANPEMRRVKFGLIDRLVLTPIELVSVIKPVLMILGVLMLIQVTGLVNITWDTIYPYLGAVLLGTVATPALLPWIPGRAFAWKGWLTALIWALVVCYWQGILPPKNGVLDLQLLLAAVGYVLVLPAISAYLAMNFTGASTYTSLSGVEKEMKYALPLIIGSAGIGILATVISLILNML
ncbi:MAG: mercury methylation corrinoid protein HgcA [Candidatus Saccharibacteria bacterium]